jgi:hypothetical protein
MRNEIALQQLQQVPQQLLHFAAGHLLRASVDGENPST